MPRILGNAAPVRAPSTRTLTQAVVPRVERHYRIIEELRARSPRRTTTDALASSLGVTPRTVERDLRELKEAGVPIRGVRGSGGGYELVVPRQLEPVEFAPAEAAAVVAALVAVGPLAAASAQRALAKTLAALTARRP